MELTEQQRALLPTDDDVRFYKEHGFYQSRKIFTDEEIDAAVAGSERYYSLDLDDPGLPMLEKRHPQSLPEPGLRKNDYASFFNTALTHLVHHPLLGAIAARLAETPEIRLWHDQLLYKPTDDPAKKANVGWHTDRGYWKTCSSANMLTAWIPFHDCGEEQGTITMVDGSQHWPDNTETLDFFSSDLSGLEAGFRTGDREVIKMPMQLKKGEISFHHCLTIHGSGPNRTDHPRRSIAIHLQDQSNRWQQTRRPDGSMARHANDELVRQVEGHPDYTDPDICPHLYGFL